MNRRDFLKGTGFGIVTTGGYFTFNIGPQPEIPIKPSIEGDALGGGLPAGFKEFKWNDSGTATISFKETHDMGGFGMAHSSEDDVFSSNMIYSCDVPDYGGSREVPVVSAIQESDTRYPSRKFKIAGHTSDMMECGTGPFAVTLGDTLGSFEFEIPDEFDVPTL